MTGADDSSARAAAALSRSPSGYSLALRLRDAGVADGLLAECLAVEREALDPIGVVPWPHPKSAR